MLVADLRSRQWWIPTRPERAHKDRRARAVCRGLLVTQVAAMLAMSTLAWSHSGLSWDFSIYNQAAWLIGHGHLDPYDTVRGMPFIDNNAELVLWPLGLLTRLPGGGWWLLAVQDLAIGATGWIALSWVFEASHSERWRSPLAPRRAVALVTGFMVVDPLAWSAASFDFHTEVLGGCFALALAHRLWKGEVGRAWILALLALCSGDVSALYVLAVAVGALFARGLAAPAASRRHVLAMGALALGWLTVVALLGANAGSTMAGNYGYVVGTAGSLFGLTATGAHLGLGQIALGALTHPLRWMANLAANARYLGIDLVAGGLLGLASSWGAAAAAFVFLPAMLAHGSSFARAGFQNEPVVGFMAVGSVFVLARLVALFGERRRLVAPAGIAAAALVVAAAGSIVAVPGERQQLEPFTGATAALLARTVAAVPPGTEVVVSQSIAGRFSPRTAMYAIIRSPQAVPVRARRVEFVLRVSSTNSIPSVDLKAMVAEARGFGARLLVHHDRLWVLAWTPPPGTGQVVLRGPIESSVVTDPTVFLAPGAPPCAALLCPGSGQ